MINKLRKKIIVINAISVCLVFFVGLLIVFSIGYGRLHTDRNLRMEEALSYDFSTPPNVFAEDEMFTDIALVQYDVNQQKIINLRYGPGVDIGPQRLAQLVSKIVQSEEDTGWLPVRTNYRRVWDSKTQTLLIAIYDIDSLQNSVVSFIAYSVITLLVGVGAYFIISIILARVALKPVEDSWNNQRQFVADASHELKTPISVILANTEIIASHQEDTVQSQMKWIENTRLEANRMAELVADLLFLAKNDDGVRVEMKTVNISDCTGIVSLGFDALFYENGKVFTYDIKRDIVVKGNEGQLKQLVTILLDNANKYSKGAGDIQLLLQANGKQVELVVSNDSDELTDEQIKHLFDRFYTLDPSRNKNKGGNGLGLSIAQKIVQSHGGKITASYHAGRTTFTVLLPQPKVKNTDKNTED